eukprot:9167630-Pyramimonas_sp.AAC.1
MRLEIRFGVIVNGGTPPVLLRWFGFWGFSGVVVLCWCANQHFKLRHVPVEARLRFGTSGTG